MSESEFWSCTLRYLYNRLEGHKKQFELETQVRYEVARYQAMQTVLPHLKAGAIKRETDLGKFFWELSEAEREEMERKSEPNEVDGAALKAMQDRVDAAIAEGRIKWEPVKVNEIR